MGSPARPEVLIFDVNETLLDLAPLKSSIGVALGGRGELLPQWFSMLLHHSLVATVGDSFRGFGEIGAATLQMLARSHGVDLSTDDAHEAIAPMLSLPPHPDVLPALQRLEAGRFRMVALTNSTAAAARSQLRHAGIDSYLEAMLSVEEVGLYKPHGHVYRWAAGRLDCDPSGCMMIAAHGWDVAGAQWAGMRAAFIARPGQQLYPLAPTPEIVEPDLAAVADRLLALT